MKKDIKNIISIFMLLACLKGSAQQPSFYIRSIRSIHLENVPNIVQPIPFKETDVVYNKIAQFLNGKITVTSSGTYDVSAFANINPGVMGTSAKDSIQMELYLFKNYKQADEAVVGMTAFSFTYGNFDVASSLNIETSKVYLQTKDELSLWVKILPSSTIGINKSTNYDHVTKPTGMEQIAGIRMNKILQ